MSTESVNDLECLLCCDSAEDGLDLYMGSECPTVGNSHSVCLSCWENSYSHHKASGSTKPFVCPWDRKPVQGLRKISISGEYDLETGDDLDLEKWHSSLRDENSARREEIWQDLLRRCGTHKQEELEQEITSLKLWLDLQDTLRKVVQGVQTEDFSLPPHKFCKSDQPLIACGKLLYTSVKRFTNWSRHNVDRVMELGPGSIGAESLSQGDAEDEKCFILGLRSILSCEEYARLLPTYQTRRNMFSKVFPKSTPQSSKSHRVDDDVEMCLEISRSALEYAREWYSDPSHDRTLASKLRIVPYHIPADTSSPATVGESMSIEELLLDRIRKKEVSLEEYLDVRRSRCRPDLSAEAYQEMADRIQ